MLSRPLPVCLRPASKITFGTRPCSEADAPSVGLAVLTLNTIVVVTLRLHCRGYRIGHYFFGNELAEGPYSRRIARMRV